MMTAALQHLCQPVFSRKLPAPFDDPLLVAITRTRFYSSWAQPSEFSLNYLFYYFAAVARRWMVVALHLPRAPYARGADAWRTSWAGSMGDEHPGFCASTSPFSFRMRATLTCLRPRTTARAPHYQSLPQRHQLQIFHFHGLVTAITERSLFTLPMPRRRMVAMMPPCACPGGP